ncbi:hypothetical protein [Croceicoccus sp. YJ47]|uniref:hypothetical protein n=1 Tax=Croceicoccus sp. YJ47 TaxID=2798724 RepID=UPI0019235AB2|nr:hypothetical protein [Croceicoccus sp. YJ47]QQN73525.1 hypothetical protein JD971_12000 [Croceicoccus sp. YJ47]
MPLYIPPPGDIDHLDHARRWADHVAQGRIGEGPRTTPALLIQHMRNEEVLLGTARTVRTRDDSAIRGRW